MENASCDDKEKNECPDEADQLQDDDQDETGDATYEQKDEAEKISPQENQN